MARKATQKPLKTVAKAEEDVLLALLGGQQMAGSENWRPSAAAKKPAKKAAAKRKVAPAKRKAASAKRKTPVRKR